MTTTAMFTTAVTPAARAVPSRVSRGRARRGRAPLRCDAVAADWREKSRPIAPGGVYPAKEHCSSCGLCDTYYVAHVKDACAFLGDGMSRVETLEPAVHGRGRDMSNDELRLGVVDEVLYARKTAPVEGAQWTGIVTSIAIEMLKSGKVEGVVCVASQPDDPMRPRPILATTVEEIMSSRGVKPSLSPNLSVLAEVEARGLKRLLFIGVGCAVTALRSVEPYLGLDALYVVGTNCTDNGRAETLSKFLGAASDDPATVTGYEFMQDYRVHLKHHRRFVREGAVLLFARERPERRHRALVLLLLRLRQRARGSGRRVHGRPDVRRRRDDQPPAVRDGSKQTREGAVRFRSRCVRG